jgi:hypothetical protein
MVEDRVRRLRDSEARRRGLIRGKIRLAARGLFSAGKSIQPHPAHAERNRIYPPSAAFLA